MQACGGQANDGAGNKEGQADPGAAASQAGAVEACDGGGGDKHGGALQEAHDGEEAGDFGRGHEGGKEAADEADGAGAEGVDEEAEDEGASGGGEGDEDEAGGGEREANAREAEVFAECGQAPARLQPERRRGQAEQEHGNADGGHEEVEVGRVRDGPAVPLGDIGPHNARGGDADGAGDDGSREEKDTLVTEVGAEG